MTRGERFGLYAFFVLVVGLALHNAAMAELWDLGVRGRALDVVSAWKESLLLLAFLVLAWKVRRLPPVSAADVLALLYAAIVVVYAILPQAWLDGAATTEGRLLAVRHHLLPVGAYAVGRLLGILWRKPGRLGWVVAATAAGVALIGLLDLAFVSLQSWRDSGVPGWYRDQLGLHYEGLSGLPENWVFNTGHEDNPIRRLVSTFLSPLASAYVLVVALVFVASRRYRVWSVPLAALLYAGLLYTHTRAAFAALALGLLLLALAQRRWAPAILAAVSVLAAAVFVAAYPTIGPSTSYTPAELAFLRENAQRHPGTSSDPFSGNDASTRSHLSNLRDGLRTVIHHPQGYGLGNTGVSAKRTGVEIKAGESTYTELGVDAGIAGLLAFVLWSLALLRGLWRREAWIAAAFAAVLFLGLQTDVIGVHWIAVVVWGAAGMVLAGPVVERDAEVGEPTSSTEPLESDSPLDRPEPEHETTTTSRSQSP
ncbi:MAG TPA: O-antigen ligase family protein [Gaiellaceae bacterium]|nr:O-antigen ligase family protein [Gaiellaceae bacterium]